ncbi:MAG: IS1634 family transposase [Chlamydiae bacterium]|nr:IS1634 family transposase [Chlamydiota bacterium]
MFIRCKPYSSTKKTVLICENHREGKKVVQKVIKYFGIAQDAKQLRAMRELAKREIKRIEKERAKAKEPTKEPPSVTVIEKVHTPMENIVEKERFIEGFKDIFGPVFDELQCSDILSPTRTKQLKDVVLARIASPCSKLRTAELLLRDYGKALSEDQIYKLMDAVFLQEQALQLKIFNATKSRCIDETVDVLFFDVTTLYFESQDSDELRSFGYSKDHKVGEVQVVLALATTSQGFPVGYTLFPGNTGEVRTLLACLQNWKKHLNIKDVVVVADRAMMSRGNLKAMDEAGFKYVIAAKLKSLPQSLVQEILKRKDEQEEVLGEEKLRIKEYEHEGRRLLVSYSENRAVKDRSDRARLVEKIENKLGKEETVSTRKLVTNKGYLKYTNEKTEGKAIFDKDMLKEEEKWDGLHGVITNDKTSKAVELLQRYRGLWVIEESFRINKHSLEMRPVYHFKPERIRAHILICYIAFALSRYVQHEVRVLSDQTSIEKIRQALLTVQISVLEDKETGTIYRMPSKIGREAELIYRSMGVKRSRQISKTLKV